MCLVAWPAKIKAAVGRPPAVRPRRRRRPDGLRAARASSRPQVLKGYPQSPIEGESFAASLTDPDAPGKATQFYAMLGQRSIYHQGWLACTVHPPISGWGKLRQGRLGALPPRDGPGPGQGPRRPASRSGSRTLKSLWFYYAGIYNGLPLDDRSALEQVLAERPRPRPGPYPLRVLPRTAPTCPSWPAWRSTAVPTPSPPGSRSTRPTPRGCSTPTAGWPAATASTSRIGACTTPSTGSAPTSRRSWPTGRSSRRAARVHGRVRGERSEPRSGHARASPAPSPSTWTTSRWAADRSSPSPATSALVGDGICVGRDSALTGHPRLRAAVPLHRRHHRQGGGRRVGRPLRRPRGPGAGLVRTRLIGRAAHPTGPTGRTVDGCRAGGRPWGRATTVPGPPGPPR